MCNSKKPSRSGRAMGPRPSPCMARTWSRSPPSSPPSSRRIKGRRVLPILPNPYVPHDFLTQPSDISKTNPHPHLATPTPHSRQPPPSAYSQRPLRQNGAIHPGHPPSLLLLIMARPRRPHTLLLRSENTSQPSR